MALIRGIKCEHPCPKCEVSKKNLLDFVRSGHPRTKEETSQYLEQAAQLNAKDKEKLLKDHGLRDVPVNDPLNFSCCCADASQNAFSELEFTDAHRALTPDRLHINHGGAFPVHLWVQLKRHLGDLGSQALDKVDKQYVSVRCYVYIYPDIPAKELARYPAGMASIISTG